MRYIEKYKEAKAIMLKMIKKGYFDKFASRDIFYLFDEKSRGVSIFSERIFNESYGIQFFFGMKGINYLHDALSSKTGFAINHFFSETVLMAIVKKADLSLEDVDYLHRNKLRICENNLIPFAFREGYGLGYLSNKQLGIVINYLYYLMSLIDNEMTDILENFSNSKMVLALYDTKQFLYEVRYVNMVNFEMLPNSKPINKDVVAEYEGSVYTDDICHFLHCYLPLEKEESKPFPSILLAYYENKDSYEFEIIDCEPKQITEYVYGFMDNCFKKKGLPTTVVLNNRQIYSMTNKTLKALNIDVQFERENEMVDSLFYDIIEEKITEEKELRASSALVS